MQASQGKLSTGEMTDSSVIGTSCQSQSAPLPELSGLAHVHGVLAAAFMYQVLQANSLTMPAILSSVSSQGSSQPESLPETSHEKNSPSKRRSSLSDSRTYKCTAPGCSKSFTQLAHLKIHQVRYTRNPIKHSSVNIQENVPMFVLFKVVIVPLLKLGI